jgi:hypothetical protein
MVRNREIGKKKVSCEIPFIAQELCNSSIFFNWPHFDVSKKIYFSKAILF